MTRFLVWAGMAAMVLGLIVWEAARFEFGVPDSTPRLGEPVAPVRAASVRNNEAPVASWIGAALERPLFREDRRPAKPVLGALQVDAPARLIGVITGPFGKRAIFLPAGNSKPIVVSEGARVSDFQVRSINPGEAIVETEGGVRTLRPSLLGDPSSRRP